MLDGHGELALAFCTDSGFLAADDAGMWIKKSFQDFSILVIDMFDVVLAEVALFCHDGFLIFIKVILEVI